MTDPCEASGAGDTVASLAKGYILNTDCIGSYKLLLKKQREYKQRNEDIQNATHAGSK